MKSGIIKKPIISEKSLSLASEQNSYTFLVDRLAHKRQLKEAIENLFEVEVLKVNTVIKYKRKNRTGKKRLPVILPKVKKALFTLKKGQSIDLFDLSK